MSLRFARASIADIEAIRDYIAQRDPGAAERIVDQIGQTIEFLRDFPNVGHAGIVPGARELVVPGLPYVVVYQVSAGTNDQVVVLRVYHAAQDRE